MERSDFSFDLPDELIAQAPAPQRSGSRLLVVPPPPDPFADRQFCDLAGLLAPGDTLVVNDTRVIPARLRGRKESGGRVEILAERMLDASRFLAQVRSSKPVREGARIEIAPGVWVEAGPRSGAFQVMRAAQDVPVGELFERFGHVPLPPYITREDTATDRDRYQTVYARQPGAVAAPTAGLHFDQAMLDAMAARGVEVARVTLHVGAGTFAPVRADRLEDHRMHEEFVQVPEETCLAIARARDRGARVVAVGTTSVRALETAALGGQLAPYAGQTSLFIHPGFPFRVVDALVTNFHLPESTLLMLVCAFAGTTRVLDAYRHAVAARYRFFSYGDAMFLPGRPRP